MRSVFSLPFAFPLFVLIQKVEQKIKAHPNRSGRWAGSAAVALCVICNIAYDRLFSLDVPGQAMGAGSKRNDCAAMRKYCRRCICCPLVYSNKPPKFSGQDIRRCTTLLYFLPNSFLFPCMLLY
jgi:hypothetical protein